MAEPAFAFAELIKLVVALGVTIGLFYALALFMKRLQVGTGKSGSLITVLGAMPLGGKEKIWVVDVAGEKLVIGTTPGHVNCLHVLKGAPASFPRMRESCVIEKPDAVMHSSEASLSSFRRRPESSVVEPSELAPEASDASPASFPRKRESSQLVDGDGEVISLDSRLRGNDDEVTLQTTSAHSDAARAFADILGKLRIWQK